MTYESRMQQRPTEGSPDSLCSEDLKQCVVRFYVENRQDEVRHGLHPHYSERDNTYPMVSTVQPFRGLLCRHEREYLLQEPGHVFSKHWRFELEVEGIMQRLFGGRKDGE